MEIYQAIVAATAFVLVVILGRRAKLPASLALLVGAFMFELVSRRGLGASGEAMSLGFAQTVETAGFAIIAGALITAALEATGAADRLAAAFAPQGSRRGSGVAVLLGLASSVVPSATVALALLRPWCRVLAGPAAASRAATATMVALALSAGQAFIFPCVLAVATGTILKISPLHLLLVGLPLALVASLVGAWYVAMMAPRIIGKDMPGSSDRPPPSRPIDIFTLVLPTLLPIALMSVASYAQSGAEPLGRDGRDILGFWAKPSVVLILCFGFALLPAWRARAAGTEARGWLDRALTLSAWPLLLTGIAGGFAAALQNAGMAEVLGERIFALKLGLFVPFLAVALMKTLHGSSLVAALTAAGMLEPLLPALGLDAASGRLLAAGAIGAGTLVSHVNDPLFWLVGDIAGLDAAQTLRLYSGGTVLQAAVSILLLWAFGVAML